MPDLGAFIIKATKPERSEGATRLYRRPDDIRLTASAYLSGRSSERKRVEVDMAPPSRFKKLPRALPIDYYAPAFFNKLPSHVKARCATSAVIAFPPNLDDLLTLPRSRSDQLSDAAFYNEYAEQVLETYDLSEDGDDDFEPESSSEEGMGDIEGDGLEIELGEMDGLEEAQSSFVASFLNEYS